MIKVDSKGKNGHGHEDVEKVCYVDFLNTLDVVNGGRYIIKTDHSEIAGEWYFFIKWIKCTCYRT